MTLPLPFTDKAILFEPTLFGTPQTISLSLGELTFAQNSGTYTLFGTGRELLTISGNNASRVFSPGGNRVVLLKNFTITGGNAIGSNPGYGGAIQSSGWLSLDNLMLRNNSAANFGGALYSASGTIYISRTTIDDNVAVHGGGIYVDHQSGQVDLS